MAFWSKQDEPLSRPEGNPMGSWKRDDAGHAQAAAPGGDLLLGAGAEFEGKLTFAGTVRIDARFKGTIVTNDVLVVGDRARIDADITCGTVIVHGEVNGNIKARTAVELHAPAKLRGDVETPSFSMEKGVVFQGQSTMPADRPAGLAASRPAAPASGHAGAEAMSAASP
jgi:cytoskeletal protein CcmA (bactofilin family)